MDEENKNGQNGEPEKYEGKLFAWVAIGLCAAGAVAFGLAFSALGIYALIASLIFQIASLTFVNLQKKKNDLKWLLYIKIVAYALFAAAIMVFAGGTIWSAQTE